MIASPEHAAALASARLLVSGSAALPVPVFEQLRELTGQEYVNHYATRKPESEEREVAAPNAPLLAAGA